MRFRGRLNTIKTIINVLNLIIIVLFFNSCKKRSNDKSENQIFNYSEYETVIYNDCSIDLNITENFKLIV